jgi:hypothetical protein
MTRREDTGRGSYVRAVEVGRVGPAHEGHVLLVHGAADARFAVGGWSGGIVVGLLRGLRLLVLVVRGKRLRTTVLGCGRARVVVATMLELTGVLAHQQTIAAPGQQAVRYRCAFQIHAVLGADATHTHTHTHTHRGEQEEKGNMVIAGNGTTHEHNPTTE